MGLQVVLRISPCCETRDGPHPSRTREVSACEKRASNRTNTRARVLSARLSPIRGHSRSTLFDVSPNSNMHVLERI